MDRSDWRVIACPRCTWEWSSSAEDDPGVPQKALLDHMWARHSSEMERVQAAVRTTEPGLLSREGAGR